MVTYRPQPFLCYEAESNSSNNNQMDCKAENIDDLALHKKFIEACFRELLSMEPVRTLTLHKIKEDAALCPPPHV